MAKQPINVAAEKFVTQGEWTNGLYWLVNSVIGEKVAATPTIAQAAFLSEANTLGTVGRDIAVNDYGVSPDHLVMARAFVTKDEQAMLIDAVAKSHGVAQEFALQNDLGRLYSILYQLTAEPQEGVDFPINADNIHEHRVAKRDFAENLQALATGESILDRAIDYISAHPELVQRKAAELNKSGIMADIPSPEEVVERLAHARDVFNVSPLATLAEAEMKRFLERQSKSKSSEGVVLH